MSQERWLGNLPAIFDLGLNNFEAARHQGDRRSRILCLTSGTTVRPQGRDADALLIFLGEVEAVFDWVDLYPGDFNAGQSVCISRTGADGESAAPAGQGLARRVSGNASTTTQRLRALSERNITAFAVVPQFFYLIHERLFPEIAETEARSTQKVFSAMIALNRTLRKVMASTPDRYYSVSPRNAGTKNAIPLVTGGSRFDPAIVGDFHDPPASTSLGLRLDGNHPPPSSPIRQTTT